MLYFQLQSPASFGKHYTATQLATINYQDQKHELLFQLEIDPQRLVLVGLTPSGTRLFTIINDHKGIQSEGFKAVVEKVKPEYLLADIQIALWPESRIRNAIQNDKVEFTVTNNHRFLSYTTNL